ncbi:hypothetical protein BIW11_09858 [Tropilaelaps mercedesae]|uniref:Uncharacterized protein n=1 Tax=Tropilaelaps mercedesae TaxID=418985 RepID=A0A1V9XIA3_9ACAR|nr:hypothetical protein BIW11_09858 [Tropilaelaps mercedesae]
MCVPIGHCPQLRRSGLRRLSKYICGFEHDTPLLCCEMSPFPPPSISGLPSLAPPPLPPQTIRFERLEPLPSHHRPIPIPLLCKSSTVDGRRWKSCWYLALQRVDILEDQDVPAGNAKQHLLLAAGGRPVSGSGLVAAQSPAGLPILADPAGPSVSSIEGSFPANKGEGGFSSAGGSNKPSKTSVTSER